MKIRLKKAPDMEVTVVRESPVLYSDFNRTFAFAGADLSVALRTAYKGVFLHGSISHMTANGYAGALAPLCEAGVRVGASNREERVPS